MQFSTARQDLILRVAQAYFDVLLAQDSLGVVEAQKTAISEQLEQAKRNFEVGTSTIADYARSAGALRPGGVAGDCRAERPRGQAAGAAPDHRQGARGAQGAQGEGGHPAAAARRPAASGRTPQNGDSYQVQVQQAALEIAAREVERNRAGHYPTLDLVASYGHAQAGLHHRVGSVGRQRGQYQRHRPATGGADLPGRSGVVDARAKRLRCAKRPLSDLENARRRRRRARARPISA